MENNKRRSSKFYQKSNQRTCIHSIITDGRAMYKSIAHEFNVDSHLCIFHAILNNNNDAKDECKSLAKINPK